MSGNSARPMTFQARPSEVFPALLEAARRAGFQYLAGDVGTGSAVFTSGKYLLMFGEKVTVRWKQVAPETVEVTLSSDPKFGVVGWPGRRGQSPDRLSDELRVLLPHTG